MPLGIDELLSALSALRKVSVGSQSPKFVNRYPLCQPWPIRPDALVARTPWIIAARASSWRQRGVYSETGSVSDFVVSASNGRDLREGRTAVAATRFFCRAVYLFTAAKWKLPATLHSFLGERRTTQSFKSCLSRDALRSPAPLPHRIVTATAKMKTAAPHDDSELSRTGRYELSDGPFALDVLQRCARSSVVQRVSIL